VFLNLIKNNGIKIFLRLAGAFVLILVVFMAIQIGNIPSEIYVADGISKTVNFRLPVNVTISGDAVGVVKFNGTTLSEKNQYNLSEPIIIEATQPTEVKLNLLGVIPIKNVKINVTDYLDGKKLVPGGQSIGVTLYTKGALIVGISDIKNSSGQTVNPAREAGLRAGDVIEYINGIEVNDSDHLSKIINESTSEEVTLGIRRGEERFTTVIVPQLDTYDNVYRMGVWVRDSTAGVGTLTFYDQETRGFGGLGHAITDLDTGEELSVRKGEIISSKIIDIVRGEAGTPGELKGEFKTQDRIGSILKNSQFGIYGLADGTISNPLYPDGIPVAKQSEVHEGPAILLSTVDDEGVKGYSCNISNIQPQNAPQQKSFLVTVTDQELLAKTGGIVQGMSGSPVIQDGKLIGAVTHVFVNDPTRGYGIYIEWMLEELYK
jgi:stage IV sporulation protein B